VQYTTRTWQDDTIPVAQYGPGLSARQPVRLLLGRLPDSRETRSITQVSVQGRLEYQVSFAWPAKRQDLEGWPQRFTSPLACRLPRRTVAAPGRDQSARSRPAGQTSLTVPR
jgi:hypothetical protein